MSRCLTVLAGLVAAALVAGPAYSAEGQAGAKAEVKPAKAVARKAAGKEREKASASFGQDLDQIATQVGLNDEQKKKLQALKEECDKDLAKYDQSYDAKIAKAQERYDQLAQDKKNPRSVEAAKQIKADIDKVHAGRETVAAGFERKMFAALTPEQRAKWNAPILAGEMTKEFSLVFLDAKQTERIESLCEQQAKRLSIPLDPEKHASALDPIKMQVYRTILNKSQQAEYRKIKTPINTKEKPKGK